MISISGILVVLLLIALVGVIVWALLKIPMPPPFQTVIVVVAVVLLILFLIGLLQGSIGSVGSIRIR